MSISCDCSVDHGEYPEFGNESFQKARKIHKCCECRENILPGQEYNKYVGKWDFGFETYKTCMACYRIRKYYCSSGYIFGELVEHLDECLGFDYRDNDIKDDEE